MIEVHSFATGKWIIPDATARPINSAVSGVQIARAGNASLDYQSMLDHGRNIGGPALRAMTFHDRAKMIKALALYLGQHKQALYDLSFDTGATMADHKIDVDGGIGTLFVFASKGRREMPDGHIYMDGDLEQLSGDGSFMGQHICTPLRGVAVHINAFNFPVWGMLEKLAPALLAGMPAIVKPATSTSYVTEKCVRILLQSGLLPKGALQLISGGTGDLLDRLTSQDMVSFTGSAQTAGKLRSAPHILQNSIRFTAEQDSLNASILGPDATPDTPEFSLFIKEITTELTAKTGQKCTAIRRIIVPQALVLAVRNALCKSLASIKIGDPRDKNTQMGPLVSMAQKRDVLAKAAIINQQSECIFGDPDFSLKTHKNGAFIQPMLFLCHNPDTADLVHTTEAFGPVATLMGYRNTAHAIDLANKADGSLVVSVFTRDLAMAREFSLNAAAFHGRLYFNNRDSMAQSTGHGAPLPHMVHGGPGRAGGGEELGGIRAVLHYMQRTAVQGSPDILSAISETWVKGAAEITPPAHPFTRDFDTLEIGETIHTPARKITLQDIEHFAGFTGDNFYAHMDETAAAANPFFPGRVAHGYLLLSFAAGLFVEPNPGPVLANTGLENLRFLKPVEPEDSISAQLTLRKKTRRNDEYGEVRWHVALQNQHGEPVAEYELLTMVSYSTPLG